MKRFFKFIFNAVRNLSLLLVLGVVGLSTYLSLDEKREEEFYRSLEAYEKESQGLTTPETDDVFGIMGIDEPAPANYEAKKIKIDVKGGSAYLRPSQIMYINAGSPATITMHNDSTILTNVSLMRIEQLLQEAGAGCFFRIRSSILNCNYVLKLTEESSKYRGKYRYQDVVKMEDGEEINISKIKARELEQLLDELTF